jgi:Pentapeptide repeats (8 copies)
LRNAIGQLPRSLDAAMHSAAISLLLRSPFVLDGNLETKTVIEAPNGGYAIERGIEENDRLEQANLGDANLGDAKLIGAHLDGAHLEGAGLIGAKLTELQARLSSVPFSACQPAAASP